MDRFTEDQGRKRAESEVSLSHAMAQGRQAALEENAHSAPCPNLPLGGAQLQAQTGDPEVATPAQRAHECSGISD